MTEHPSAHLLASHQAMLTASAISADVATQRGYRTVESKAELKRLGFGANQLLVPTLLAPIYNAAAEVALLHHRPDMPRMRNGKPAKYEFPAGQSMAVDVHPFLKDKVRDPNVPLFITEGVKKADSAISAGLCCIAVVGVWNWRGGNEYGGKTALPDWEAIALKDRQGKPRQVYLCFDSDVMLKAPVYQAMARLKAFLESRGARVALIYLPPQADGSKNGLDDYLAAGHTPADLLACASPEMRPPPASEEEKASEILPYRETPRGLVHDKQTRDGLIATPLANFTARIEADIIEDDGAETRRLFEITVQRAGRCTTFSLPAASFAAMNWPAEHLGAGALLYPGLGTKDHARVAIQLLSGDPPLQHVFAHTGWREVALGQWDYLHAGGTIGNPTEGESGSQSTHVRLSPALERFRLPEPPQGDELVEAVRSSLHLLNLMPDALSFPLLGATYRAAMETCDFSVFVAGPSGAFKSEAAALFQQHFGAGLDARHLPAAWSSTDNFLEGLAFTAKDALLTIDDFAPTGTAMDVQRLHSKADRVLRGQGNNAARGRMRADGTLRATKPPRGLILSTGEDVPQGVSLRGRMCILELTPGDITPDALTTCQADAASGRYAASMAGFLCWLAPRYAETKARLREEITRLRTEAAASHLHRRTPEITANLGAGLRYFLRFAVSAGALDKAEARALWLRGWAALGAAAQAQMRHQAASEPTLRFLELLSAALASGKAHVAGIDGGEPVDPQRWGWRSEVIGSGEYERQVWEPKGDRVGWAEGDDLYLQPDAAYNTAKRLGSESGDSISLGSKTLNKRLKERGLLVTTDEGRDRLTVRKMIAGNRQVVLHLHSDCLMSEKPSHSAQPEQNGSAIRGGAEVKGPISWDGFSGRVQESAHKTVPFSGQSPHIGNGNGTVGPISHTYNAPAANDVGGGQPLGDFIEVEL